MLDSAATKEDRPRGKTRETKGKPGRINKSGTTASAPTTSSPTTTKTIHHPAETIRIAICDTCGADITDDIEGHKKSTGHPWYHYDAKVVKEAGDETVTVK